MDSAYHLWVNGKMIGYSQGSRNAAEFDISNVILKDELNFLRVKVYQWSDGSYIEDQDMWVCISCMILSYLVNALCTSFESGGRAHFQSCYLLCLWSVGLMSPEQCADFSLLISGCLVSTIETVLGLSDSTL